MLWVSGKYIKKNWCAAGLELTTPAPSRTIVKLAEWFSSYHL